MAAARSGQAICESPNVGKVFFTGSVEVGRKVGEVCAKQLKGSVLELGGKDPQIVCADADLANAVSGCVWGGFANSGQTCSGIERTYVVESVADRFLEGVVRETERLTVGDPMKWETEIGPMVSAGQAEAVTELVDDALKAGAERVIGGPREVAGFAGRFIAPTVLAGVEDDMRIMREEIFGPVVPVIVVADEEEALERANDSNFGLGASIWTTDRAKGERMARRVESGMVWINDHSYSHGAGADLLGRGEGVRSRPLALEVRLLRVRQREAHRLGAGPHPRLLVAALRPHARRRPALVGAPRLRPERRPGQGAS